MRAGCVHLLLAEDREEFNLDKAQASYREVQKAIYRAHDLEFYADVERLLPDHVKPAPLERVMEIKPYVREERGRGKRSPKAATGTKRKRNDDLMRNIPSGASTGFVSVAELIVKGSKKGKCWMIRHWKRRAKMMIWIGNSRPDFIVGFGAKRSQSFPSTAAQSNHWDEENVKKPKGKGKMKKATTKNTTKSEAKAEQEKDKASWESEEEGAETKRKTKREIKSKVKESSLTLSQQGRDDSIDRELSEDLLRTVKERMLSLSPSRLSSRRSTSKCVKKTLSPLKEDGMMDLSDLSDVGVEQEQSEVPCEFGIGENWSSTDNLQSPKQVHACK